MKKLICLFLISLFVMGCSSLDVVYVKINIEPSLTYNIDAVFSNDMRLSGENSFIMILEPNKKYTFKIYATNSETKITKTVTYIPTEEPNQCLTINLDEKTEAENFANEMIKIHKVIEEIK